MIEKCWHIRRLPSALLVSAQQLGEAILPSAPSYSPDLGEAPAHNRGQIPKQMGHAYTPGGSEDQPKPLWKTVNIYQSQTHVYSRTQTLPLTNRKTSDVHQRVCTAVPTASPSSVASLGGTQRPSREEGENELWCPDSEKPELLAMM